MKIVYCLDSINYMGGIQRVTVMKANALAGLPGNEVWVIVADNSGDRFFDLSPAVHFIDLGVNYYEDDWKSRWGVLKGILVKRRRHKNRLTGKLKVIRPDVVISVGTSEKNFLPYIKGDWVRIREYHFTRDYRYRASRSWLGKIHALAGDLVERLFSLGHYDRIVTLTREDKDSNWKGTRPVSVIPNPVETRIPVPALLTAKRIIAVGRLSYQKDYPTLIRAFSLVSKRFPEWQLDIFGDGGEKSDLTRLIAGLSLEDKVHLRGNNRNVLAEMLQSSMLVLSSRFEGFGMVLTEAMSCGLPVVAFPCPCGPKDIITDQVNGLLIPQRSEAALADGICRLIEDDGLRKSMGEAAFLRSKDYSVDKITELWMDLFASVCSKR